MSVSSTRTLILGLDTAGTVLHCDRGAAGALALEPEELLGTKLRDLVTTDHDGGLDRLLEAVAAGRESTAMLTVGTRAHGPRDSVVSVHPMTGDGSGLAALAIVRVPMPSGERFTDPALMRHALLDGTFARIGALLDLDQMGRGLMDLLVPHFCSSGALVVRENLIGPDDSPAEAPDGQPLLRRVAIGFDDGDPSWDAAFPTGEVFCYPPGNPAMKCLTKERSLRLRMPPGELPYTAEQWDRPGGAEMLRGCSLLLLPLTARGTTLGFLACVRASGHRPFDEYDVQLGMEFASRAALFVDNARRYGRERATALTLQRSLLPTGLTAPAPVEVHHRYLPGSRLIEVGGDWYESIPLPGARVALVVGDVAGHGVRAAVTMGRLRTAIQTLAGLDLPPAEALQHLDELMRTLGEREPHFATCAYAVYDTVTGVLEVASAGHPPPLVAGPDGADFLDLPPAPPLGIAAAVGGAPMVVSRRYAIEDGSILVLYTDGLVENRSRDIDDGLARLRTVFDAEEATTRPLAALCQEALDGMYNDHHRDDIAMLIARLGRIPEDDHMTWELPGLPTAAREARSMVREKLGEWGLAELSFSAELAATELVTNAVRHGGGGIMLRLVRTDRVVCEVFDGSDARPKMRPPEDNSTAESGRGLQVVSRLARRWGVRPTPTGKSVWCELDLP
jgi:serine phosphatase RsbU (regulator of sigma subunit)/anti-sigma regulatory factor (Ser/Thr protein kinase)